MTKHGHFLGGSHSAAHVLEVCKGSREPSACTSESINAALHVLVGVPMWLLVLMQR